MWTVTIVFGNGPVTQKFESKAEAFKFAIGVGTDPDSPDVSEITVKGDRAALDAVKRIHHQINAH